ncbi:MAG: DUF1153 domain-containing protein [Paracoccaceae bacterium]
MQKIVPFEERRDVRQLKRMREDLPPPGTQRWVASRKAAVVAAVDAGAVSAEEVCTRYELSPEELEEWRRSLLKHGPAALLVTKLKYFRNNQRTH